jgi:hypothetical protein
VVGVTPARAAKTPEGIGWKRSRWRSSNEGREINPCLAEQGTQRGSAGSATQGRLAPVPPKPPVSDARMPPPHIQRQRVSDPTGLDFRTPRRIPHHDPRQGTDSCHNDSGTTHTREEIITGTSTPNPCLAEQGAQPRAAVGSAMQGRVPPVPPGPAVSSYHTAPSPSNQTQPSKADHAGHPHDPSIADTGMNDADTTMTGVVASANPCLAGQGTQHTPHAGFVTQGQVTPVPAASAVSTTPDVEHCDDIRADSRPVLPPP